MGIARWAGSLLLFCAATGAAQKDQPAKPPRVTPPEMTTRAIPELKPARCPGTYMTLSYEVTIDSLAQPVISTLKVFGCGATENRDAIADWIQRSRFKPAMSAGEPTTGLYKGRARLKLLR